MAQKEDIIYSSIPIGDYEEDEEEFKGKGKDFENNKGMPFTSEAAKDTDASRSSSPDLRDPDYWAKVADKGKGKAEPDKDKGKGSGKGKGEGRQTFLQDYWTKAAEKGKGDGPRDAGL